MNPYLKVLMQRPGALMNALTRSRDPDSMNCPSCGGDPLTRSLDRRFGILTLKRCSKCHLLFRTPTDTPIQSSSFYQEDYTEETVTELPDADALSTLKSTAFAVKGSLTPYLELMRRFQGEGPAKLLDYGCSWGYNTWRFQQAGFTASGVEVSRPRCDYGKRELGVDVHYSADNLPADYDIFFSSHVFEHVPSPARSFEEARRLLGNKGGICIIITPNGCVAFRKRLPGRWHELWGRKHPNFLDDLFWKGQLSGIRYALMSRSEDGSVTAPIGEVTPDNIGDGREFDLAGEELILIARIPPPPLTLYRWRALEEKR